MPPQINGKLHTVLVVKDAKRSAEWYQRVFGFMVVRKEVQAILPDQSGGEMAFTFTSLLHVPTHLFLGLAEPGGSAPDPFDWRRAGLQHLGLHVESRSELDDWSGHLDRLGIEHSAVLQEGTGYAVRFRDPDQIPVEVFWPDWQYFGKLFTTLARSRARSARERRQQKRPS